MYNLTVEEMDKITASDWSGAIKLATQHESFYAEIDEIDSLLIEPAVDEPIQETIDEPVDLPMDESVIVPLQETSPNEVLKCEHCHFETVLPSAFQCHRKTYIVCYVCALTFCGKRSRRHHETHFRRTHDFKPKSAHICNICKKPFGYKSDLKTHLKRSKCGKHQLIEPIYEPIVQAIDEGIEEPVVEHTYELNYEPINQPHIG